LLKKIVAFGLILLALVCMGSTVCKYLAAKGRMGIWSENVMGAALFHGGCMIAASFLLARRKVDLDGAPKEGGGEMPQGG